MDPNTYQRLTQQAADLRVKQGTLQAHKEQHAQSLQEKNAECQRVFGCSLEELPNWLARAENAVAQDRQQALLLLSNLERAINALR